MLHKPGFESKAHSFFAAGLSRGRSVGPPAPHRRAQTIRRINDLRRRSSFDADAAVRMRWVRVDFSQATVLDGGYHAAGEMHIAQ